MSKLWGGRFTTQTDPLAAAFNASLAVDWRMAPMDVQGSIAWAHAIQKAGVLSEEEAGQIIAGLRTIQTEIQTGKFPYNPADEDVHTAIERRLGELIGPSAGKLHTGRSRNDQVMTDFTLWLQQAAVQLDTAMQGLQSVLLARACSDLGIILPGYTHLQRAQPILLSHWWLSHFWPLQRDRERLAQLKTRASVLPLGAGALAGAPYPVDRQMLAAHLGLNAVSANSLDAVSNRDTAAEFLFTCTLTGVHLSRMAEMLILFSTAEFGFIELSDAFSTGSSLMPQKKNPDMLELARGKAGTLIGRLTGLLATLKGLPSAYDKDLQEDKPAVFEAADTLAQMLPVMAGLIGTLSLRPERMQAALDPALLATDLADYLVARAVPFREAHNLVGQVVKRAVELGVTIAQLPLEELQTISPVFEQDASAVFDALTSVSQRSVEGGTAPTAVQQQITLAYNTLYGSPEPIAVQEPVLWSQWSH